MCNFQGLIKKEVEFPGVTKKNHVEFPGVLVFSLGISKGCNTILENFQGWSFVLIGISRGKVKNEKFQGGYQKSMSSNPPFPCLVFSGIAIFGIYVKF